MAQAKFLYAYLYCFLMGMSLLATVGVLLVGRAAPEPAIVLIQTTGEGAGIYAIDANRVARVHVGYLPDSLVVDVPTAATDGSRMVYETSRDGKLEIAVRAGASRRLYDTGAKIEDRLPALSPNGSRLAYWSAPEADVLSRYHNWNLKILDLETGEVTAITDELAVIPYSHPVWSPDGSRLMVRFWQSGRDEGMFVVDTRSGTLTSLRPYVEDTNEFTWSPDGTKLAFRSTRGGSPDIFIYDSASGTTQRLTDHPASDFSPAWSPDGLQIAFVSNRSEGSGIYVVSAEGGAVERIFPGGWSPHWSPDSTRLAVISRRDGVDTLSIVDAAGRHACAVTALIDTSFVGWLDLVV